MLCRKSSTGDHKNEEVVWSCIVQLHAFIGKKIFTLKNCVHSIQGKDFLLLKYKSLESSVSISNLVQNFLI